MPPSRITSAGQLRPVGQLQDMPYGFCASAIRFIAQAFVSGFCSSKGHGMSGGPNRQWRNPPLCRFGPVQIVFRQSVGWEDSFQVCYLRCPTKRGIPKQTLGKSEGTTRTMVKNWGIGVWQAQLFSNLGSDWR